MHSLDSLSLAETEEDYYYLAIIMLNNTAQASPHSTRIFGFVRFGLGLDDDDDDAVWVCILSPPPPLPFHRLYCPQLLPPTYVS